MIFYERIYATTRHYFIGMCFCQLDVFRWKLCCSAFRVWTACVRATRRSDALCVGGFFRDMVAWFKTVVNNSIQKSNGIQWNPGMIMRCPPYKTWTKYDQVIAHRFDVCRFFNICYIMLHRYTVYSVRIAPGSIAKSKPPRRTISPCCLMYFERQPTKKMLNVPRETTQYYHIIYYHTISLIIYVDHKMIYCDIIISIHIPQILIVDYLDLFW